MSLVPSGPVRVFVPFLIFLSFSDHSPSSWSLSLQQHLSSSSSSSSSSVHPVSRERFRVVIVGSLLLVCVLPNVWGNGYVFRVCYTTVRRALGSSVARSFHRVTCHQYVCLYWMNERMNDWTDERMKWSDVRLSACVCSQVVKLLHTTRRGLTFIFPGRVGAIISVQKQILRSLISVGTGVWESISAVCTGRHGLRHWYQSFVRPSVLGGRLKC